VTDYGHIGRIETGTIRTCWPVCMCCGLRGSVGGPEITKQVMGHRGQIMITCEDCWKKAGAGRIPFWDMPRHGDLRWVVHQWEIAAAEFGTYERNQIVHLSESAGKAFAEAAKL